MAITTKFLEELGISKEVAEKIFAARGEEVERDKAKLAAIQADLTEKTEAFEKLNAEFETLKSANADGAEWKTKFEALQAENEEKAKQAETDRILREKTENVNNRFNAAVGEKKFSHGAIRDSYLKKFGEALESADYQGKSDTEIFHELTKDDGDAFKGATVVKLAGGKPSSVKQYNSKADIMAIKDRDERRTAIAENLNLFNQGE